MYAIIDYLYKNNKLLLRGTKENLEKFVEDLKELNPKFADRREFEIRDSLGYTIKKWNRK